MNPTMEHHGKASSFADPKDIAAFRKCKQRGGTDKECFKRGDNGIGCWGDFTGEGSGPLCAIRPDDMIEKWGSVHAARDKEVMLTIEGKSNILKVRDRMPWKEDVINGAVIDVNPDGAALFDLKPPFLVECAWKWLV